MQKVLCRFRVRDVAAILAGLGEADLGVEVGAVEIDLAAMGVDDAADVADLLLEHAVGGRIGDHDGGELVGMLLRLCLQIGDVHIAVVAAGDHHHLEARHDGGGRIGAVSGGRDEADVAAALAPRMLVGPNGEKAGEFALGARIGLQRHGVVAGDAHETVGETFDQLGIALQPVPWARTGAATRSPAR